MMESDEQQLLWCTICNVQFDNDEHEPKLLSCHHSFCRACLLKINVESSSSDKPIIRCPTCRKKTVVPAKGVTKLQTNFYVAKMRNLLHSGARKDDGNRSRGNSDVSQSGVSHGESKEVLRPSKAMNETGDGCDKHSNQPLLFYCETCMVAICMHCTVLDHDKARGHEIKDIQLAYSAHAEVLQDKIKKLETAMNESGASMKLIQIEASNMNIAKTVALQHIDQTFNQLTQKLQQKKESLTAELHKIFDSAKENVQGRMNDLKGQVEEIRTIQTECQSVVDSKSASQALTAATNAQLMSKIDQMCVTSMLKGMQPNFIKFDHTYGLSEYMSALKQFGKLSKEDYLPTDVRLQIKPATSSIPSSLVLTALSANHLQLAEHLPVTAEITDPCGDRLHCKLQSQDRPGIYTLKYRPQMPGTHQVNLKFLGHDIRGAQQTFNVEANNPVMKLGSEGSGPGELFHPTSVSVAPNGDIYITDMGNKRIQIFTHTGEYKDQIRVGKRATIYDLTINHFTEELLYSKVLPDENGRPKANTIKICDLHGNKKMSFENTDMKNALFSMVNNKGWIIATDSADNKVYIFSKEGRQLKVFGGGGDGPGQFNFPSALCVGQNDDIIICDTNNHRIQQFSKEGSFIKQISSYGSKKGMIKAPRGVAVDQHGQILVADSQNRIQIFRYDGTFVACVDSTGDKISDPYNMAVTKDGRVMLADFKNNCVKVYKYM